MLVVSIAERLDHGVVSSCQGLLLKGNDTLVGLSGPNRLCLLIEDEHLVSGALRSSDLEVILVRMRAHGSESD